MKNLKNKISCKICGSKNNKPLIKSLRDYITNSNLSKGTFCQCIDCGFVFLEEPLLGDDLINSYKGYYTQLISKNINSSFMGDDRFSLLKPFYLSKYISKNSLVDYFITLCLKIIPLLRFFLLRAVRFLPTYSSVKNNKLLDVGCGNGKFLLRARDIGYEVYGIDFDPTAVDNAMENKLSVDCGNLLEINYKRKFDAITMSHVIEHLDNPLDYIKEIYRLLKPGAYFYIATPNIYSSGFKIFRKYWRGIDYPRHLSMFSHKLLKNVLKEQGFVGIEYIYDLPQSINIAISSYKIASKHSSSNLLDKFIYIIKYILSNPFLLFNHEVIVIKAYKPY
tara:strand:- start:840 stop:1844 length:1005 start_codon:yes stop_codon:yes gene_type:complete